MRLKGGGGGGWWGGLWGCVGEGGLGWGGGLCGGGGVGWVGGVWGGGGLGGGGGSVLVIFGWSGWGFLPHRLDFTSWHLLCLSSPTFRLLSVERLVQ